MVFYRQKEESWMKLHVGDVLRIDNDDQIPVSHTLLGKKFWTILISDKNSVRK